MVRNTVRPPFPYYGGTGNGGEWRERTEVVWSNRSLATSRQAGLFDLAGGVTRAS